MCKRDIMRDIMRYWNRDQAELVYIAIAIPYFPY